MDSGIYKQNACADIEPMKNPEKARSFWNEFSQFPGIDYSDIKP